VSQSKFLGYILLGVGSVLEILHLVDVGHVDKASEIYAAFIFKVDESSVGKCYFTFARKKYGGLDPVLSKRNSEQRNATQLPS
jgi:hypothetical protein